MVEMYQTRPHNDIWNTGENIKLEEEDDVI